MKREAKTKADKMNSIMDKSLLVIKDNDLIQKAKYNLTANQQKVICYAISKIKPTDNELQWTTINIAKFCDMCGIDKNHFYSEFKSMMEDLDKIRFWVETDKQIFLFRWFSEVNIEKGSGVVKVLLNSNIRKYLIDLSKNFTKYELGNILELKSKYAIRLYEYFKSYSYQKSITVELDKLKKMLCAENYTTFKDFKKRVLEIAVDQINEYTDLKVKYETVKEGRSITTLIFYIDTKSLIDILYNSKEEKEVNENEDN